MVATITSTTVSNSQTSLHNPDDGPNDGGGITNEGFEMEKQPEERHNPERRLTGIDMRRRSSLKAIPFTPPFGGGLRDPTVSDTPGWTGINDDRQPFPPSYDELEIKKDVEEKTKKSRSKCAMFFLQEYHKLPDNPTVFDKIKYSLLLPPHGPVARCLSYLLLFLFFWGSLVYTIHAMALPGGVVFSLIVLIGVAQIAGMLVAKVNLPPLLGMLLVGIMFRSAPYLDTIGKNITPEWGATLRSLALCVILIRAGLGLDPDALRKLSFVVLRLSVTPCLTEANTVAIASHFILQLPWKWGYLLGFVLGSVSPAVVVPCLLNLSARGYGVEKGIPTLVMAASSMDDVYSISGFSVFLGLIFSSSGGSTVWQGFKSVVEFGIGIVYGIVIGMILWILPNKTEKTCNMFRFLLLFFAGVFSMFGSVGFNVGGAGAMGVLMVAFVAGIGWRKQDKKTVRDPTKLTVDELFNMMWVLFQPVLFALIGSEISIPDLKMETVGLGIATLCCSLTLRITASFCAVACAGFTLKERLFIAFAWLPKATVQAAIGSTALDFARAAHKGLPGESQEMIWGQQVLTIAVLAILITAPIGAVVIMLLGPRFLAKAPSITDKKEEKSDVES